jgi:hypothetical protein
VKVFAVFVLVLAGLVPTHADTTQKWALTSGCNPEFNPDGCFDTAQIRAVLTTTMENGTFTESNGDVTFTGVAPVVTNIVGTFDGMPMTLISTPGEAGNWLLGNLPQDVTFMAGGIEYDIFWDSDIFLVQIPSGPQLNQEVIGWNAVPVPEPNTLLLFSVPLFLGLSRWAQMSLRKLSER